MAVNLVATRGNRATATILGAVETEIYNSFEIPEAVRKKLRQIILDQMNGYKDLVIDIVKSETAVINEHYLQQISEIHQGIQELKRGA
jgi:hypothetical protein